MGKSKTTLEKVCKKLRARNDITKEYKLGEGEDAYVLKVEIKTNLLLEDKLSLINDIADLVISPEKRDVFEYVGGIANSVKQYMLVTRCTNVPEIGLEDVCTLCEKTSLIEDITEALGENVVKEIFLEADKVIKARVHYLEGQATINKLIDKIISTIDKIQEKVSSINPAIIEQVLSNISQPNDFSMNKLVDTLKQVSRKEEDNN